MATVCGGTDLVVLLELGVLRWKDTLDCLFYRNAIMSVLISGTWEYFRKKQKVMKD